MGWLKLSMAVMGGLAMVVASADPGVLEGKWGGDRLRLVVDTAGATVETDCATGRIAGPIKLSAGGGFQAMGTFEQHQGGPQRADAPASSPSARYSGQVEGDVMTLSITPAGATTAQTFRVRKGAAVKLVRCL
jgi:hypothetical protein